jgi:dephospho-CoA kinase
MTTLGLTGGIGMGKSAAADCLARRGFTVIDTDQLARQVVEVGQPALEEIRRVFGDAVLAADGTLRRTQLARRVFADAEARRRLEAILHPRIHALWQHQVAALRDRGAGGVVVVIPLLYETGTQGAFEAVVCLACSEGTHTQRLRARGWTDEEIRQRNAAQLPVRRKMELADVVVWSEGPLEVLDAQCDRLLRGRISFPGAAVSC